MSEDSLAARYQNVLERVKRAEEKAGRGPVCLVAVSKYKPIEAIEALYRLGHRDFGENYVQDLVQKSSELAARGCGDIRWHFIGRLQSNKAKALVEKVSVVHSVDSAKTGVLIARRWQESGRAGRLPVFLQVNIDEEPSKAGLHPGAVAAAAKELAGLRELELEGLMCIPDPATADGEVDPFDRMRELVRSLGRLTGGKLSMGMTHDYEEAIRKGATHVRVGTAIFGSRG